MVSLIYTSTPARARREGPFTLLLRGLSRAYSRVRRDTRSIMDMRSMSDHQLRDLGLHRSEIELRVFGRIPYVAGRRDETA